MPYDVAVIGTGENPDDPGRDGFAMAYRHAPGYQRLDTCDLVACADIVRENAEAFAIEFDLDGIYEDYMEMLQEEKPDIVSVCVPPSVHSEIVNGCAESNVVEAIHCEKPMAETWDDCTNMVRTCERHDVQLTINHQLRFGGPFRAAKERLDNGEIGELKRIEFSAQNLFDAGTHQFDLCNYFVDQAPVEWVIAQIDYREKNIWFGTHNENQAITQWKYENGIFGIGTTGDGSGFVDCYLRLVGSEGIIEIGPSNGPTVRMKQPGSVGWTTIDPDGDTIYGPKIPGKIGTTVRKLANLAPFETYRGTKKCSFEERAIEEVIRSLDSTEKSELSAQNALQATEIIFASWESARQRGRVDFPIRIEDNPLQSMVESGELDVNA